MSKGDDLLSLKGLFVNSGSCYSTIMMFNSYIYLIIYNIGWENIKYALSRQNIILYSIYRYNNKNGNEFYMIIKRLTIVFDRGICLKMMI